MTVIEALAAMFDTDTDHTRDVWRDGQPAVRGANHVHMCWTKRKGLTD